MKTGNVSIVRDGLVHFNGVMEEFKNISFKPKSLAGNVNLGLNFWKNEEWVSFAKIGNLNIFASKLSIEAMKSITNGSRCGEEGDYIAWSKSKWFYTGNDIKVFEVEMDELCGENRKTSTFITPPELLSKSVHTCARLGNSELHVPTDEESAVRAFDFYKKIAYRNVSGTLLKYQDVGEKYWIGAVFDEDTKQFVDIKTKQPLEYFRWKPDLDFAYSFRLYKTRGWEGEKN